MLQNQPPVTVTGKHNCETKVSYLYFMINSDIKNTIKYEKYYAKQPVKTFFYEQPVRHCMCYDWVGLPAI